MYVLLAFLSTCICSLQSLRNPRFSSVFVKKLTFNALFEQLFRGKLGCVVVEIDVPRVVSAANLGVGGRFPFEGISLFFINQDEVTDIVRREVHLNPYQEYVNSV